jgi:hypothetical protein
MDNRPSIPFQFTADMGNVLADADAAPKIPNKVAGLPKPPGLIGEISEYVFSSSHRPVPEIAMSAAFGMVAGIAGRAFNISGVGLNQFIVLIAKTGTGKEAIGKGIDRLFSAARKYAPQADVFQGPASFASGQALARILPEKPAFVSVLGEFGYTLQGMAKAKPGEAMHTLKRALMDIYNKSGAHSWLKPTVYSDREKNTALVQAPNVTFVGESTPEAFYKGLDEGSIMDGFVPRLMLIEYKGDRPAMNDNADFAPPDHLVRKLSDLINVAISAGADAEGVRATDVIQDEDAHKILRAFNDEIDSRFQGMPDGALRQILNRAHLKALKLAALLAVGVNHYHPVVTKELAQWAIQFVRNETAMMAARFESGEIGEGEDPHRYVDSVKMAIAKAFTTDVEDAKKLRRAYRIPAQLDGTTVIPHSYLMQYLKGRQPFKGDKRGPGRALSETIAEMLTSGLLVKLTDMQAKGQFKLTGTAYFPNDM